MLDVDIPASQPYRINSIEAARFGGILSYIIADETRFERR